MSPAVTRSGILVGVDGSAESDAAIRWATHEAVMRRAAMTLMHVVAPLAASWPMGPVYADITEWQRNNARHILDEALKVLRTTVSASQLPDVHIETLNSSVVPTLVRASENHQMIVVGSRGSSALGRLLLGSVSTGLVHHASCPVAVIRPEPEPSYGDPAGHRRVTGLRSGDGAGLRRGLTPRGRSGGIARVERRGSLSDSGYGLARVREPGTRDPERATCRLAGTVPRRACAETPRLRSAGPLADS
jgi:nucleotide-binding universal stress UspA family protein